MCFCRVGLIFSNWLLMYLSTEEVRELFTRLLDWLEEGGCLFFRESCFNQSGISLLVLQPIRYQIYTESTETFSETKIDQMQQSQFAIVFALKLPKTGVDPHIQKIVLLREKLSRPMSGNSALLSEELHTFLSSWLGIILVWRDWPSHPTSSSDATLGPFTPLLSVGVALPSCWRTVPSVIHGWSCKRPASA